MDNVTSNPPALPPSIPAPPPCPGPELTPFTPVPSAPTRKPKLFQRPGVKRAVYVGGILAILGACTVLYARATIYGKKVVQAHPVDARIELANAPAYLDAHILNTLLAEAYQYAQQDQSTYDRTRNALDASVLREYAELYTGTQRAADGTIVAHQAMGYNAWIKSVTAVRRNIAPDKSIQSIQIFAEWRVPVAWIRVGENLYLIDGEGTRLPGDYTLADHAGSKLMIIAGVEGTFGGPAQAMPAPQPGAKWVPAEAGPSGALGADLVAGMTLSEMLRREPYAGQIAAINVSNINGRHDLRAPWIVLETGFPATDGTPRMVDWGRPIGQESFYEVKAEVKLKTLREIYQRFNRIDANRDYVDIRTEVIRLPKLAMGS